VRESVGLTAADAMPSPVQSVAPRDVGARERIVLDHDADTGTRLAYYLQAADVEYWTDLWKQAGETSYARASRGHLPHQLRQTFRRWAKRGGRTLEAGCGLGHFTVAANALGYRAEGLDWSAETIETIRQRFPSIPWHVGDVRSLEFATESFDTVYSPGVCEHFIEGPITVLSETHRILRRGGVAIVSTPCFNRWQQRHVARVTRGGRGTDREFYQYAFTPDGLTTLLRRLGFEVVQVRPYAALDTFIRYAGWHLPPRLAHVAAGLMDYVPVVRDWGSTCIWVARKC
jgi:SAM-dependent methyltransferase